MMPSTIGLPTGPQAKWGAELADSIQDAFPNIAAAVRPSLLADCAEVIKTLHENDAAKTQVGAIFIAIEGAMNHILTTNADRDETISGVTKDRDDYKRKWDESLALNQRLTDTLLKRSLSSTTAAPRRTTKDPSPFTGDEKDVAKRQIEYQNWRSTVLTNLAYDEACFPTVARKIGYVSQMLGGTALRLHRKKFDNIVEHENDPAAWHWQSVPEVLRDLNKLYETLDLSQAASRDLDRLQMKNKPFQNFLAEFVTLAEQCHKTEEQKVDLLRRKVSYELSEALKVQAKTPPTAKFDEWCELCQSLYNNRVQNEHYDKMRGEQGPQRRQQNAQHTQPRLQPVPPAGDPMILDASRQGISREQCYAQGLCVYCKQPGHFKADCEEKKKADQRRANAFRGWNSQATGQRQSQPYQQPRPGFPSPQPSPGFYSPRPDAKHQASGNGYGFYNLQHRAPYQPTPAYPKPHNRVRALENSLPASYGGSDRASNLSPNSWTPAESESDSLKE